MRKKLFKRTLSYVLALAMIAATIPAVMADDAEKAGADTSAQTTSNEDIEIISQSSGDTISYTEYREKYAEAERPAVSDNEGYIYGGNQTKFKAGDGAQVSKKTVDGKEALDWANQEGKISFPVNVSKTGVFNIKISYEIPAGGATGVELNLKIDGKTPYDTASRITLDKRWVNETEIKQDYHGNDIRPGQVEQVCWQEKYFADIDGLYDDPLWFYLEKGKHTISFESTKAMIAIESIKLYQQAEPDAYKAPSESELSQNKDADIIVLEGEEAAYKTDRVLYPTSDKDSYLTSPSDPNKTKYNTIGSANWTQATQAITWKLNVKTSGYYKIGVRARQNQMRGFYSNRRFLIDGVVPNKESDQVKFYYNTEWDVTTPKDADGNVIYYYLEAGEHELTMEAVPGEIGEVMSDLDDVVYATTSYYRRVRQITGPDPDEYNNYMIDVAIPSIVPDFKELAQTLRDKKAYIEGLTGTSGTEAVTLEKMALVLDQCIERPDDIPSLLSQIKDNITSVSSWVREYRGQPLEVDLIEVAPASKEFTSVKKTFFGGLKFGFDSFVGSFFSDYNSLSAESEDSITVWVSLGRDQAQVVNQMVDSDFNPNSDTKVSINLVQGGVVEATLAGKGPDAVLFLGGDFPIQLAARDVLTDLTTFDDYDEVMSRFQADATTLYKYNKGVYGIPVSQLVPMMFYRTDILAEQGINPERDLQTWDQLISILPQLQRNYMEVGLILPIAQNLGNGITTVSTTTECGSTFASLILQQGLNYYNEEQTKTTFDTQEAVSAFEKWTKFYTTYSFDQTYDAFSRFRTGDMPILIKEYNFFNQLSVAAPEIRGCWDFKQIPGTIQEDGSISHASNSSGTCGVIFKKCKNQEAAWNFLKWFTSTESQIEYANDIEAIMGTMGRFDTANLQALDGESWSTTEVSKIKSQFAEQVEIPVIPASYAVTRNVMNAFRETVNNASNPRDTLMWYNKDINAEITRKLEDLSMYKYDDK